MIGHNIQYSRYADDITVSFPHMQTMEVLQEKCKEHIDQLQKIEQEKATQEEQKKALEAVINNFSKDIFTVSDNYELKYLQKNIHIIKELVQKISKKILNETDTYQVIASIDKYKKQIKYS